MTSYSTVIFDLDGTLLDTLEDLHLTLNHTLAALGMPTRTLAETRAFVGNGIRRLIERAVPAGTDEATVAKANAEFDAHYAVHCNDHTRPYPGVPELLARLRGRGVRLAVVSNKTQYAVDELVGIHFEGAFDAVVGVRPGPPAPWWTWRSPRWAVWRAARLSMWGTPRWTLPRQLPPSSPASP